MEVRDGAHGYAELIDKFCGKTFPPIIMSKDQYLWLRFHSDDTLEYQGFKGVFEHIKNPREYLYFGCLPYLIYVALKTFSH